MPRRRRIQPSTPLWRRQWFWAILLASLIFGAFLQRGPYYQKATGAGWFFLAVLGASFALVWALANVDRLLGAARQRQPLEPRHRLFLVFGGGCAVLALFLFLWIGPSLREARALLAEGKLDEAELHIAALARSGDQDPEFLEARNDLVLAKVTSLSNREAIDLLARYISEGGSTASLEEKRRRLRLEWFEQQLRAGELSTAEAELRTLQTEGASEALLSPFQEKLGALLLQRAQDSLESGHPEDALTHLSQLPSAQQADPKAKSLLARALQGKAQHCAKDDVRCAARLLKQAIEVDPEPTSRVMLSELRSASLKRGQEALSQQGDLAANLRVLEVAIEESTQLLEVLTPDPEIFSVKGELLKRREDLVAGHYPLGEPIEVAKAILGSKLEAPTSTRAAYYADLAPGKLDIFLFASSTIVEGIYVVAKNHRTEGMDKVSLQAVAQELTGQALRVLDLSHSGKGIQYTRGVLGKYPVLFGWSDSDLVEVAIGKVEP